MQLYHIVLGNLKRRKAKMLFVLLGMAIGIAAIVSVYTIVNTMQTEMTRQASEFGINVVITPDAGGLTFSYGGITLPEIRYDVEQMTFGDAEKISQLPSKNMIRVLSPKLIGLAALDDGRSATVVGADLQQEFTVKPWLLVAEGTGAPSPETESGGDEEGMAFDLLDLSRQDLEMLNLSDNQALIGASLAHSLSVGEGDVLMLMGQPVEIRNILTESGAAEDRQIFMNLAAVQTLLERPGDLTVIDMAVDYSAGSEDVLLTEIAEALPNVQISSMRQETLRRDDMLQRLVRFGTALSSLIVLVGMLMAGLSMSSSVRERTREIGIFGALGFRKAHIAGIILMEAAVISVAGGILGCVAGLLAASYAGPIFIGQNIQISWNPLILLASTVVALVIGVLSSLHPAYKAARLDPAEALRFI